MVAKNRIHPPQKHVLSLRSVLVCAFLLSTAAPGQARQVLLNEVMSSNTATLVDEDGAYPDWIELYNPGPSAVPLAGWGLSDDPETPLRWRFPDVVLEPDAHLLVMASGKDRADAVIHLETVVDRGDTWHYHAAGEAPSPDWHTPAFDDTPWPEGPSGFGYGDQDDATDLTPDSPFDPGPAPVFVRTTFTIDRLDTVHGAVLHVDYDDAFVAYLNGEEISRANIGRPGTPPAVGDRADADREAHLYRDLPPEWFRIDPAYLREGRNLLALQVHNVQAFSTDLSLIPFLTLEMSAVPPGARGLSTDLTLPLPGLHTNFRLDAQGETLLLSDADGREVDRITLTSIPADHSFGRSPGGGWAFFAAPTPGRANTTPAYRGVAEAPLFSTTGGFYETPLTLSLSAPSGTDIRYTLDGSVPADSSRFYDGPFPVDATAVVRARAFGPNLLPGRTETHTYLINEPFTLPVVSLAFEPGDFFDTQTGLYVMGPNARPEYPHFGANFWKDWERPVHVEFLEANGEARFGIDAGVQIFGSWSRLYPQKSLALFARGRYGDAAIPYAVFPNQPFDEYQSLVLRNAGQDWGRTFFRDALVHQLARPTGLDVQAYRPVLVYFNGRPWGIHNLREKLNEHYLAAHHGVDPEAIDLIERDTVVVHGDDAHYRRLIDYAATHDLNDPDHFAHIRTMMDVDNFSDYVITVLFAANPDWPWNNVKAWRPRHPEGRWRWMLYDLDYAFNGGHLGPSADTFAEMQNGQNRQTGTTRLFLSLLDNDAFRRAFINRFADHLNTTFAPARIRTVIDSLQAGIAPAMPHHIARWQDTFSGPWWLGQSIDNLNEWTNHIEVARRFGEARAEIMRQLLADRFGLTAGTGPVSVNSIPGGGGRVRLNSLVLDAFPWNGIYFRDVPVTLTALPNPGYLFTGWTGATTSADQAVTVSPAENQTLTARFEAVTHSTSRVVINEIHYTSTDAFDPDDWVELYNPSDTPLDLGDWSLKDGDDAHVFTLPAGTRLPAGGYLILARDTTDFRRYFPAVAPVAGNFGFGFSSEGETVRLYDADGVLVDSVRYDVTAPWPDPASEPGATLALHDPFADNALAANWTGTGPHGTPGAANDVIPATHTRQLPDVPERLALYPNYPNPFSTQTTLAFDLPKPAGISLTVYDVTGRAVATIFEGTLPAGRHLVLFDASALPSGLYVTRLKAGPDESVRTMLVLR